MLRHSEQQAINDLLDSDDEIPLIITDDPDPDRPAYTNDRRFDKIKFNWIDIKKYYGKGEEERLISSLYSALNEDVVYKKTQNLQKGEKALILKGVLNQEDIYCLQCIEPIASDATLLWFINFLIYKDLQSGYRFLKTCLVDSIDRQYSNVMKNNSYLTAESKKYNFDIVIKNS